MEWVPDGDVTVAAVVVTHDRRASLEQCLDRLRAQTRPPDTVLVVDNASSDGTPDLLAGRPDVQVMRMARNEGGAGGFKAGLEAAVASGHTWAWLMDDDTFCEPSTLEALLAARTPDVPMILASRVEWTDGTPHPMNQPWPKTGLSQNEVLAAARAGVMPMRAASFVSVLISREAVARYGLPHAAYFLYNDDLEYTARILRRDPGYWVPNSVAIHHTAHPRTPANGGGERFYYSVRNRIHMLRGRSWRPRERLLLARHLQSDVREFLRTAHYGRAEMATVARGVRDGVGQPAPKDGSAIGREPAQSRLR